MFSVSYVALTVRPGSGIRLGPLEEAAMDLGATPFRVFFKVTLPIIAPGHRGAACWRSPSRWNDFIHHALQRRQPRHLPALRVRARGAPPPAPDHVLATAILL